MRLLFEADMIFLLNNADLEVMEARTMRKKRPHQEVLSQKIKLSTTPESASFRPRFSQIGREKNAC